MLAQSPATMRREDDPATPENLREMRKILPGASSVVAVYIAGPGSFSKYIILTYIHKVEVLKKNLFYFFD
jgi:hypothetical protein